jgi:predicted transcriptional regulator
MPTTVKTPTTDMEVTSIRLERELKERLKELAENQGYQALIRDILWDYIHQRSSTQSVLSLGEIRASIPAIAQQEQRCALTGRLLKPQERIFLGFTTSGDMVPLSVESLAS